MKGTDVLLKGEDDEAIHYFTDILPRIRAKYSEVEVPIIQFLQHEGK